MPCYMSLTRQRTVPILVALLLCARQREAFVPKNPLIASQPKQNCNFRPHFLAAEETTKTSASSSSSSSSSSSVEINTVQEASKVLEKWDQYFNKENFSGNAIPDDVEELRTVLPQALRVLNTAALEERTQDSTMGRCMLGICASSTEEGIATLKSWVTGLELPRGLLHGADEDGVPLEIEGGVYIKYNTGGFLTFSQIRASGMGFDSLWKPGDAMLEPYDGDYRGVYFQVELADGEFRQYLVPSFVFETGA